MKFLTLNKKTTGTKKNMAPEEILNSRVSTQCILPPNYRISLNKCCKKAEMLKKYPSLN